MNENEEKILQTIISYVKENHIMPTRRFIQKALNYKSVNSITQYIKSLEKKGYLKRDIINKIIINGHITYNNNYKRLKIVNTKNDYIEIILNQKKDYLAYIIKNNYFDKMGIFRNDLLIIEKNKKIKPNDLGLFIIDNKYRIMKYDYKDGFYLLKDNELVVLNHIEIVGKVIQIIRKK